MTPALLSQVMAATWPAAAQRRLGPFTLRDGAGGGKRVSAASCDAPDWTDSDLDRALAAMDPALMLVRATEERLDQALADRGLRIVDPVLAYAAPVAAVKADLPPLTAFPHWPPLQITRAIWQEGGIGPARVQVMDRVAGPRAAILARRMDRPAGAAFVALHGEEAMVHAVEVLPPCRRQGVGMSLVQAAANWAADQGATRLSLVVTDRNAAARSLYERLGMQVVGQYHYRMK